VHAGSGTARGARLDDATAQFRLHVSPNSAAPFHIARAFIELARGLIGGGSAAIHGRSRGTAQLGCARDEKREGAEEAS
jgi:hypothetical protein